MQYMRGVRNALAIVGIFWLALIPVRLEGQGGTSAPAQKAPPVEMAGFRVSPPDAKWRIEITDDRTTVTFSTIKGTGLLDALSFSMVPQVRAADITVSIRTVNPWEWTKDEVAASEDQINAYCETVTSTWPSSELLDKGEVEQGDKKLRFVRFETKFDRPGEVPSIRDLLAYFYLPPDFGKSHRFFIFQWSYMRAIGGPKFFKNPGTGPVLAVVDSLAIDEPRKSIPGREGELIRAAAAGDVDTTRRILDGGIRPDASFAQFTALSEAAFEGRKAIVELLLDRGADVDHADEATVSTPLFRAIEGLEADLAGLLIDRGADVNKRGKDGDSPLAVAAVTKQTPVALLLLARGAEVDAANGDGFTPLTYAAMSGDAELAKLLIEKGAKIDAQSRDGLTPLMSAILRGRRDVAQLLLGGGADINLKRSDGVTALWIAVDKHEAGMAEALVGKGADLTGSVTGTIGEVNPNLLHLAISREAPEIARHAIEAGLDINAKNASGKTPLIRAAIFGQDDVVKLLLAKGADINAKDNDKRTAAWYARAVGNKETLKILKAAGAK